MTIESVLSRIASIYSDFIEPFFCLLYIYILLRIIFAKPAELHTAFYKFSVATGIAATSNVLLTWVVRIHDPRYIYYLERALFYNTIMWLSHVFSLSISIGKTLSVATRYTSICLLNRRDFWEGRKVPVLVAAIFAIPLAVYAYFPFQPANYVATPIGNVYTGITYPGFMIAKVFATCGYIFFFFTTIPMCILSVLELRRERISARRNIGSYEKVLAVYAVVLTTSHMIKSVFQSLWFVALVFNLKSLQAIIVSQYLIPNTLSAFAEPVLMLVTSSKLREEVFSSLSRGRNTATTVSALPTQSMNTRVSTINRETNQANASQITLH